MKHRGLVCLFGWRSLTKRLSEVKKEISRRMFQHGKISQEKCQSIGLWSHERGLLS